MGKRKKRNSRKRSLLFEESPVHCRQHPPSPLQCVDNPVTALTIPVDSDLDVSWISPQFNGLTVPHGKRRQARRRHHTSSPQDDRRKRENSKSRAHRAASHRNFPALKFVGDASHSNDKSAQSATRSDKLKTRHKNDSVSPIRNKAEPRYRKTEDIEALGKKTNNTSENYENACQSFVEGPDYECVETVRRRSSFRKSVKHHRPSLARRSAYCGDQADSLNDSTLDLSSAIQKELGTHLPLNHSQLETENLEKGKNLHSNLNEIKRRRRASYNSDILLSPADTSNLSQSDKNTPVGRLIPQISLRMALFSHSPSEDGLNMPSPNHHTHQAPDSECNKSSSSRVTPSRTRTRVLPKPCSHRSPSIIQEGKPRRSKRLQEKHSEALRYLMPSTPHERQSAHVLVCDTPESEYSLTVKQRQRLKRKAKV